MENKIPSIYPMKLPKKYAYENKRNKIALKKETKFNTDYFKEPIFFNKSNIDFQLNTLNIMFRPKDKSQTIQSENNSRHYINNNITNLDTETTNTETLPKLTKSEIIEKQKKKEEELAYYKNIFKVKALWKRKIKPLSNVLNIRYAENEEIYEELAKKENELLRLEGKPTKKLYNSHYLKDNMNEIKNKIKFMKCVEDFIYPGFVIAKIKAIDNMIKNNENAKNNKKGIINPLHDRILQTKNRQNLRKLLLTECIDIIQ
jgi:hypothetical protein